MGVVKRIFIGIDPGRNTGFAVWDAQKKEFFEMHTFDFWKTVSLLERYAALDDSALEVENRKLEIHVVIEDPNQNKPTFSKHRQSATVREKISQNIGANKRDAQLLIELAKNLGLTVHAIRPDRAKWTAETFKSYTGYHGRTSEHSRDAARLVYGMY